MLKIEHIGIAVKDLENSNALFAQLLGRPHYKVEAVTSEKVNTSFFQTGESNASLMIGYGELKNVMLTPFQVPNFGF